MTDDEDDEVYPEWFKCRECSGEELLPGETHACSYAANPKMSEADERSLLDALDASPIDMWSPSSPWATDEHTLSNGWRVRVFFDGPDRNDMDYIEWSCSPGGMEYEAWPYDRPTVAALPMSIANWRPREMGPIECFESVARRLMEKVQMWAKASLL